MIFTGEPGPHEFPAGGHLIMGTMSCVEDGRGVKYYTYLYSIHDPEVTLDIFDHDAIVNGKGSIRITDEYKLVQGHGDESDKGDNGDQ